MRPVHPTAVLTDAAFEGHDTGPHPEQPARLAAIRAELTARDLLSNRPEITFGPADRELVERIHDPRYLQLLDEVGAMGGAWIDPDTLVAPDSVQTAFLAAGASVRGVEAVLTGEAPRAFALVRPPGHHATRDRAMGFCLINSIAVAAQFAVERGLERIAIVDWDVHHGNGTEAIFEARNDVLFCSVHQYGHGFFPGTGDEYETGVGEGAGFTVNAPLRPGADNRTYGTVFRELFAPKIEAYQPELILISAGFDAHAADPLGSMVVNEEGFAEMAMRVLDWADRYAGGRVVAVLEGGYDRPALGRSVATVLETFDSAS
jgi:acetoin utilization deacetylase AcuC-like enzyme